jgi:hypothetical protein
MITTNKLTALTAALTAVLLGFILINSGCKSVENLSNDDDFSVSDDDDVTPSPADDDDDIVLATLTGVILDAYAQPLSIQSYPRKVTSTDISE